MDQAMHHYTRAKSIVDIVSGMGKTEQEEIDKNKVRPLLVSECFACISQVSSAWGLAGYSPAP